MLYRILKNSDEYIILLVHLIICFWEQQTENKKLNKKTLRQNDMISLFSIFKIFHTQRKAQQFAFHWLTEMSSSNVEISILTCILLSYIDVASASFQSKHSADHEDGTQ